MTIFCAVDTETGSLDPDAAGPWEIAIHRYAISEAAKPAFTPLASALIHVDPYPGLNIASQKALEIGGFYDRHLKEYSADVMDERQAAMVVQAMTADAIFVGSSPWFDRDMLAAMLARHGWRGLWHHRMRDVPTLVEGRLGGEVGGLDSALDAVWPDGWDPVKYPRHTAWGDATAARDLHLWSRGLL